MLLLKSLIDRTVPHEHENKFQVLITAVKNQEYS